MNTTTVVNDNSSINAPSDILHTYAIYTLVDMSKTDVKNGESKERSQHSNFETLWQIIQLRIQPTLVEVAITSENMSKHKFGSKYKGNKKVWKLLFTVDQSMPFGVDHEGLLADIDGVPFVTGLDNDDKIGPIFECNDKESANTYVEIVSE